VLGFDVANAYFSNTIQQPHLLSKQRRKKLMKIFLTPFLILIANVAISQNPDQALTRIKYHFIHIQDTTRSSGPHQENMVMLIGKNASVYTSFDDINKSIARNKLMLEMAKSLDPGLVSIQVERKGLDTEGLAYFYFATENKFFTKERVYHSYIIEENAPKINWKITSDTASFSGIICKKATADFLGRRWNAWYAPELPFQSGPWKLNGLPGLIIDAYDEKKEVQFQFAGMETLIHQTKNPNHAEPKLTDSDVSLIQSTIIQLPSNTIKTTKSKLDKLKEVRDKDPKGFMNAQMSSSGVKYSATTTSPSTIVQKKGIINNPIELKANK